MTAGALPPQFLAIKATIATTVRRLISDKRLREAPQDGKILFRNTVGIIHVKVNQLRQTMNRRVLLEVIGNQSRHSVITEFVTLQLRQLQYDRDRGYRFQAVTQMLLQAF